MAEVFLARDVVLDRVVAIKVLRERYGRDEEFVERFRQEARYAASLSHPNIVQVFDRGESEDGRFYIAMEYVAGGTLAERILEDGSFSPAVAAAVAAQIAQALGAAHERGMVHRDVKPQNVLVTAEGDVKVADFGIAHSAVVETRGDQVLGTAKYMSPEQARGEALTPASDLYSLGVVLYEMLTGSVPFEADSDVGLCVKHVQEAPRPPKEVDERVPEGLNAIVMKLLDKDPSRRYANASALVDDLKRTRGGLPPQALEGAETEAPRRSRRALIGLPVALASVALFALLGVLWAMANPERGEVIGSLSDVPERAQEVALGTARKIERAVVSPQRVRVPGVEDLSLEEARERLADEGLGVATQERESSEEEAGQVLEQSVPKGRNVERGSRILLAVSSGPGAEAPATAPSPESPQASAPDIPAAQVEAGATEPTTPAVVSGPPDVPVASAVPPSGGAYTPIEEPGYEPPPADPGYGQGYGPTEEEPAAEDQYAQ